MGSGEDQVGVAGADPVVDRGFRERDVASLRRRRPRPASIGRRVPPDRRSSARPSVVMPAAEAALEAAQVARRRDHGEPQPLVDEQLAGQPPDVRRIDAGHRLQRLVERQDPVVERLLAADPRREWRVSSIRSSRPPDR